MFCPNCGTKLEDGSKFCPKCGARVDEKTSGRQKSGGQHQKNETSNSDNTEQQTSQSTSKGQWNNSASGSGKKLTPRIIGIIIAAVVVIAIIVVLIVVLTSGGGGSTTVNLNNYVEISAEGYDGYGTVSYIFNSNDFLNDYGSKISFKTDGGGNSPSIFAAQSLVSDIEKSGIFTKDDDLSNGDEIKFTWTFNPQTIESKYAVNLKYSDLDYKVDTLQDLEMVDAFDSVTLEFSGISGTGMADFVYSADMTISQQELLSNYYEFTPKYKLSNGDTVTVSISNSGLKEMAQKYGQKPIETSKEYTVDGLYTFLGLQDGLLESVQEAAVEEFYDNGDYFYGASEETHYELATPKNYVGVLDENGNQLLNEGYILRDEFYDWAQENKWLAKTELQSFDYVGYYAETSGLSDVQMFHLYLIYDVCFSQYGSADENDPASPGGRSEFHYYWCPSSLTKIQYDDENMTCIMIPWLDDLTDVSLFGDIIENVTYYISDVRTHEVSENEIEYTGLPYGTDIKNDFFGSFIKDDWGILESSI